MGRWDNFYYFLFERGGLCFFNSIKIGFITVYQAIKSGTNFDIFFLDENFGHKFFKQLITIKNKFVVW